MKLVFPEAPLSFERSNVTPDMQQLRINSLIWPNGQSEQGINETPV
jgi:hypothetical protein